MQHFEPSDSTSNKGGKLTFFFFVKEWILLDSAAHAYSMISVPLYDTLGPDAVQYICSHAEVAAVGCSAAVVKTMLQCLHECPSVKLLVREILQVLV